jgi:hypothetical protein
LCKPLNAKLLHQIKSVLDCLNGRNFCNSMTCMHSKKKHGRHIGRVASIDMQGSRRRRVAEGSDGVCIHFASAWRVWLIPAGKAKLYAAGALGLTELFTLYPYCTAAMWNAWAPPHHRVVFYVRLQQTPFVTTKDIWVILNQSLDLHSQNQNVWSKNTPEPFDVQNCRDGR